MNTREHKAHLIASGGTIKYIAGLTFVVASASNRGTFHLVSAGQKKNAGSCSCPDAVSGRPCKHILAVWLVISHYGEDVIGDWQPEFVVPAIPYEKPPSKRKRAREIETFDDDYAGGRRRDRVTIQYPADEPTETARRAAAIRETPTRLPQLAAQLAQVATSWQAPLRPRGGQSVPLKDQIFAVLMKAFNACSYEELAGQLCLYKASGFAAYVPSRGSLINYQHSPAVNLALKQMLELSALPVKDIETMLAIDGTGFGTCITANSRDEKHRGVEQRARNKFMTAITAVGCATNMVASAAFCTTEGAEINYFERLIPTSQSLWPRLTMVLGDALYSDNPRIDIAARAGLRLISPTRYGRATYQSTDAAQWLWDFFNEPHRFTEGVAFDEVYRYRSKIESVFSAVKRTMGWHLRMRLSNAEKATIDSGDPDRIGIGRENELLARFIVWNLRIIVLLEKLHDQDVSFFLETKFRPLPPHRFSDYHPLTGDAPELPLAA